MPDLADSQSSEKSAPRYHSRSSTSSFLTFPVTYAVSGIIRRLSGDTEGSKSLSASQISNDSFDSMGDVYASAPRRRPSPFQPPPLTPLTLNGYKASTSDSAKLLTNALAEEIRLLVPPRIQLVENWELIYSLEQNGVSLGTLYQNCADYRGKRGGYVLVIRDGEGGVFGAYLSDAPHPSAHYYGTGECFLWRVHILSEIPTLASLPPPPSEDTTNAQRMTTLAHLSAKDSNDTRGSGANTPDRIRFKAFPYSGVNDYMIFCEQGYLSVGGGDGHYGLWLDDNLEKGVSNKCLTFGNEPLSDEGVKFDILGVELWYIG